MTRSSNKLWTSSLIISSVWLAFLAFVVAGAGFAWLFLVFAYAENTFTSWVFLLLTVCSIARVTLEAAI
jgi:hypothetical protein